MLCPVRRIVTTNDADGRSKVLIDGEASKKIGVLTELWITDRTPANNAGHADNAERSDQLEPPRHGTLFRYFQIAPESLTAADRVLDRIDTVCEHLADNPRMGPARPDLAEGLRYFVSGSYLIVYREAPGGVEIVRVVHGARHLPDLFRDVH